MTKPLRDAKPRLPRTLRVLAMTEKERARARNDERERWSLAMTRKGKGWRLAMTGKRKSGTSC